MGYKDLTDMLISGNRKQASEYILNLRAEGIPVVDIYEKVIKRSLYDIGHLWENNIISVATEHMATAITEGIMNELFPDIVSDSKKNKKVVLACVEGEPHQVGIKMIGDSFEMAGWDSYFLGANTPLSELMKFLKETKPEIAALSLSIYFHIPVLLQMIDTIRTEFPDLKIIVGGQAFRHGGKEVLMELENVMCFEDIYDLANYISKL